MCFCSRRCLEEGRRASLSCDLHYDTRLWDSCFIMQTGRVPPRNRCMKWQSQKFLDAGVRLRESGKRKAAAASAVGFGEAFPNA